MIYFVFKINRCGTAHTSINVFYRLRYIIWIQHLAYLADVFTKMKDLSCKDTTVFSVCDKTGATKGKTEFWCSNIEKVNLFASENNLKTVEIKNDIMHYIVDSTLLSLSIFLLK